ncbi:hypothetical protein PF005_g32106 [Phytophthora fragariae]|uniref:Reverse transcriptase domain-containing protein n=1 Tax=Phytophthora fragariae TaxID=53985 RepID=A0A6A3V1Y0_9STRA|nr:hypothetical protein PF005_g32106 [Phytophthora fragariae]
MDFENSEVRYSKGGRSVVIPFRTYDGVGCGRIAVVRMARRVQLDKCTVTPIEVAVTAKDGKRGLFIPTQHTGAVMLAPTVTIVRNGKALVPAINANGEDSRLPAKKELGKWVPLDSDVTLLQMSGELRRDRVSAWLEELGESSDEPLENESEAIDGGHGGLSTRHGLSTEHHIDTGDAAPIMLKRRRQAQSEEAVIETNVRKMLAAGVIKEGDGAWGFPVVLVKKKDGEVRFCVDYRALNKVTRKDVYPLPRIDETLEALGGALLFSTLDLKAVCWQIKMAAKDQEKTAFTTKQGLYEFVRMPFACYGD